MLQLMRAMRASASSEPRRQMRLVYVAPSLGANATLRSPSARAYHVTRLEHITPFVLGLLSVFNVTLEPNVEACAGRICRAVGG